MAKFDFYPSERSLFLTSLRNNREDKFGGKYSEYAQIGTDYLFNSAPSFIKDIEQPKENENINSALKLLQKAILTERQNEQDYFTNFLNDLNISNKSKETFFKRINKLFGSKSSQENFDYIQFIKIINQLLTGAANFKSILELEQKRLQDLDEVFNNIIQNERTRELRTKTITRNNQKIEVKERRKTETEIKQDLEEIYLERHTYNNSIYSQYFNDITPTIDYLVAKLIRDTIYEILYDSKTLEEIKNQFLADQLNQVVLNDYIVANVTKQSLNKIPKLVKEALAEKPIEKVHEGLVKKLMEDTIKNFEAFTINGQTHMIKETPNIIQTNEEGNLEAIGDAATKKLLEIRKLLKDSAKDNPVIENILSEKMTTSIQTTGQIKTIEDAINELEKIRDQIVKETKTLNDNQTKARRTSNDNQDERKDTINILKKKAAHLQGVISKKIADNINKQLAENMEKELDQSFQHFISKNIVAIDGPTFSEFIDTIISKQDFSDTHFTGPKNAKADTLTITILPVDVKTNLKFKNLSSIAANELREQTQNATKNFYDTFQKGLPKPGKSTNYTQGKAAWKEAVKEMKKELTNSDFIKNQEIEIEDAELIAEAMKNTIIVTDTMKTFNNYNNNIGFLSGSLGSGLPTQIQNFAELFSSAGVPMSAEEIRWLEIAIVNCSNESIGRPNKDPIERYLSLMAGFAVFDEGAAEVELLLNNGLLDEEGYVQPSPRIMHLYRLNGLYFPGSYILQRMYDNLTNITKVAGNEIKNNDGAKIDARGSGKYIPDSKKVKARPIRWHMTYKASLEVTNIRVAFISGLMDIVTQLLNNGLQIN